jgi:hypothetical protein
LALYWVRELAGWTLVAGGLVLFLFCLGFLQDRQVVEASVLATIGVVVFRGGIHLVKVATAARIVLRARRKEPS